MFPTVKTGGRGSNDVAALQFSDAGLVTFVVAVVEFAGSDWQAESFTMIDDGTFGKVFK